MKTLPSPCQKFKVFLFIFAMSTSCNPPINQLDRKEEILLDTSEQHTIAPVIPVLQSVEPKESNLQINPTNRSPTIRLFNIKPGDEVQLYSDSTCINPISDRKSASNHHLDISTHPLNTGDYQIYAKSWDHHGNPSPCSPHHIDFSYYVTPPTMTLQGNSVSVSPLSANNEDNPPPTVSLSNLYSGGSVQLFSDSACTEPLSYKEKIPETTNVLDITPNPSEENYQIYAQSWDASDNPSPCSPHPVSHTSTPSLPEPLPVLMGQTASYTGNTPTIYLAHLPLNGEFQLFSDSVCTQSVSSRSSVTNITMRVTTNPLPIGTHDIRIKAWDDDDNPSECSSNAATFTYKVIPPTTVLKRGESSSTDSTPTISLFNLYMGGKVQIYSDSACSRPLSVRRNVIGTDTMDITTYPLAQGAHRIYSKSWDAQDNPSECSPHFTGFTWQPLTPTQRNAPPPSKNSEKKPNNPHQSRQTQSGNTLPTTPDSTPSTTTPSLQVNPPTKALGKITPPVYKGTSSGELQGVRFIYMKHNPNVSGHFHRLPSGEKLTWRYSAQGQRGGRQNDGVCFVYGHGTIKVEEKNIKLGDVCKITTTVSARGYSDKSASTNVYWYGPNEIRSVAETPKPVLSPRPSPPTTPDSTPTPSPGQTPTKEFKTIDIRPPVFEFKPNTRAVEGKLTIDITSKPTYQGRSYRLSTGEALTWTYSVQGIRKGNYNNDICFISSTGILQVVEKKIKKGDNCKITITITAPGHRDKSITMNHFWQYIPVSQCKGAYMVRKKCKFNERIPYNWGNSFTHKCIKRDLVNIGINTTGSLRCTGCVVSKEYPCN